MGGLGYVQICERRQKREVEDGENIKKGETE